ncbi:MAG: hypothetical protein GWP08_09950 [Nitrospiraceae bacterium]|nr:hypothetical protein [Nitrospiraceae bacterium]
MLKKIMDKEIVARVVGKAGVQNARQPEINVRKTPDIGHSWLRHATHHTILTLSSTDTFILLPL